MHRRTTWRTASHGRPPEIKGKNTEVVKPRSTPRRPRTRRGREPEDSRRYSSIRACGRRARKHNGVRPHRTSSEPIEPCPDDAMPRNAHGGYPCTQTFVLGEVSLIGHATRSPKEDSRPLGTLSINPSFCIICLVFRNGLQTCFNFTSFMVPALGGG